MGLWQRPQKGEDKIESLLGPRKEDMGQREPGSLDGGGRGDSGPALRHKSEEVADLRGDGCLMSSGRWDLRSRGKDPTLHTGQGMSGRKSPT